MSKKICICCVIFTALILMKAIVFSVKYSSDEVQKEYDVFVENVRSVSETKVSYNVKLLNTNDKFILNIYDDSYDNVQSDLTECANYIYGDVIKVMGKVSIPKKLNNPGEFNYKLYLYSNNIHGLINTYKFPEQVTYKLNIVQKLQRSICIFKTYIKKLVINSMDIKYANIAVAMVYGQTLELDEDIKTEFEQIGVSHLMSVSGTHITSFILIINVLFNINKKNNAKNGKKKQINKLTKIIKGIMQIICICIYIVFTDFGVSVLRAGIMLIINIIYEILDKKKEKYKALATTFLIILFNCPFSIFNVGMQLSFLATLGIIMFFSNILSIFNKVTKKSKSKIAKRIFYTVSSSISVTLAVQLMIFPIQIQAFNSIPFPIIMPNLVLGILSVPIRGLGTVGIMVSFIPKLSVIIFKIIQIFVKLVIFFTDIFTKCTFEINCIDMPMGFFLLYYFTVFMLYIIINLNKQKRKNNIATLNRILSILRRIEIICIIILIIMVVYLNIYSVYVSEYVYFFNVEQGEMSYVKSGQDSVIVDIGSIKNGTAYNVISNYFESNNLNQVDAVIISHLHQDHINGLQKLLQEYEITNVIYVKPKTRDKTYIKFEQMLNSCGVNKVEVKQGSIINIGRITIEVLSPPLEYIQAKDEVNSNSLACKIIVKDKQILYMGDATIETEERLIKEYKDIGKIYILKVGHHGSKTATSDRFIQQIKPQNAVISSFKKYYGHPHKQVIDVLKKYNVYIYLTENQGAIKFKI